MKLNLIVESKNFEDVQKLQKELERNPCHLCLFGVGLGCVDRNKCRWESHKEIFIKSEVLLYDKK